VIRRAALPFLDIRVRATDAAGNASTRSARVRVLR
jgi:hypothetical protein